MRMYTALVSHDERRENKLMEFASYRETERKSSLRFQDAGVVVGGEKQARDEDAPAWKRH